MITMYYADNGNLNELLLLKTQYSFLKDKLNLIICYAKIFLMKKKIFMTYVRLHALVEIENSLKIYFKNFRR